MKYVALTLSLIAAALLLLAAAMIGNRIGVERHTLAPVQMSLPPLSPQVVADQAELKVSLQALLDAAARRPMGLMAAGSAAQGIRPLENYDSLFVLPPQTPTQMAALAPQPRAGHVRQPLSSVPLPKVSVVVEGAERKAVVDGHLVRVGDAVGDGLVVRAIQVGAVTFGYGKEELVVAVPLERLRVLGAFPAKAKAN